MREAACELVAASAGVSPPSIEEAYIIPQFGDWPFAFTRIDTIYVWIQGERVIESVTYEAAGCEKCVQHQRNPARRSFGRRLLECGGYRDSTAV
ncbi:hypothetical protein JCM31271_33330 [Halorubrum trueperi]